MKHILIELEDFPQPNQPLLLEETLDRGRWKVSDSRHGTELGQAFAVMLGTESILGLPADGGTTIRLDEDELDL